jgi:hypothetical protein
VKSRTLPGTLVIALLVSGPVLGQDKATDEQVKRGEYLVTIGGCHDCHTPLVTGPSGPEPDMSRALSGHPQDIAVTAPANLPEPWMAAASGTLTAWSGPWGVSFSANLTPDAETGVLRISRRSSLFRRCAPAGTKVRGGPSSRPCRGHSSGK